MSILTIIKLLNCFTSFQIVFLTFLNKKIFSQNFWKPFKSTIIFNRIKKPRCDFQRKYTDMLKFLKNRFQIFANFTLRFQKNQTGQSDLTLVGSLRIIRKLLFDPQYLSHNRSLKLIDVETNGKILTRALRQGLFPPVGE